MENGRILKTAACVVEALGGTKSAAEWAGVGESAVSNWLARGFIPPGWHIKLHNHFSPLGLELAPTAFGQTEPTPSRRKAGSRATEQTAA